ncbi:MAG: glutamate-5-semialdehyde dehydrogenase [Acidobacteria bacterium]|nr:glutamate-5-semialdehyde dehydrogenase [Acidobacteriota bacterium]
MTQATTPSTDVAAPTTDLEAMGRRARAASRQLATLGTEEKNTALRAIADGLEAAATEIEAANREDVEAGRAAGLSDALLDRLLLDGKRIAALAADVRKVAELDDPVGRDIDRRTLPNGIELIRRRVPLGVVGVIYEARPNVTVDIASLCLKTGNASILRGGKETRRSNRALVAVIQAALERTGVHPDAVQSIDDPDRELVKQLLRLDRWVDMLIPRGGAGLHQLCKEQSTIPVITGGIGICHVFVDESADLDRAVDVIENAKVQRPSVCNALDTLLVHRAVAATALPPIAERLAGSGVELHADPEAAAILEQAGTEALVVPAGQDDFDQEWLSLVLGIRVVDGLAEAIAHIQEHSTQHSDSILTEDSENAERFVREIDSAAVYVNASTRFTDGGAFGLGAEVAVSTQKLHARGPMGLEELTTYKWIGLGSGQIRE